MEEFKTIWRGGCVKGAQECKTCRVGVPSNDDAPKHLRENKHGICGIIVHQKHMQGLDKAIVLEIMRPWIKKNYKEYEDI
jgi:hypothetical protein